MHALVMHDEVVRLDILVPQTSGVKAREGFHQIARVANRRRQRFASQFLGRTLAVQYVDLIAQRRAFVVTA